MVHCNSSAVTTARLESGTTQNEATVAPGIFTAKTLQEALTASLLNGRRQEINTKDEECDEIVSPYGRLPRQVRKTRYRHRPNDLVLLQNGIQFKQDVAFRRKRCRKLDPMPARSQDQLKLIPVASLHGNQVTGGEVGRAAPDKQRLAQLRSGLQQTNSKQLRDADRLKSEIQWIHGHFPVLKLANSNCSRTLRQQLFRNAVVHCSINFMLRKALKFWYQKLLDAQRKERLQLSASRQLIAMFEKVSFARAAGKFNCWREWVFECQAQENVAAAITLQHFARSIHRCCDGKEAARQQVALVQALQALSTCRNARTIQRAYRRHRLRVQRHRCEAAARKIQRVEMRRTAHDGFIRRQNAAKLLQQTYRAHTKQRSRRRAKSIAQLFDRSRESQATRIQTTWLAYKSWRDWELPLEVVGGLVDQIEFFDAVLSIQRHLRGFQCRFRMRKKNKSAVRIQRYWRGSKRRVAARAERRMMFLRRDMAASCLQRAFIRTREERKIRRIVRQSARPMYLRARHLGESFRQRFRVPIAKSAIAMIQTTWRRHILYEKEKQRKLVATTTIQSFLRRGAILSKWRSFVVGAPWYHRDAAARTIQRRVRHLRHGNTNSKHRRVPAVYVVEQISAAIRIQRWHRHYRGDSWHFVVARLLTKELPRCIEAVNRIAHCWRAHSARKQEKTRHSSFIARLIEQQRRSEGENRAARLVQRMFKRMIDRRDGKLMLHRYKIVMREDIKRRQQRVIVHKFLEEKSEQRKKQNTTIATRRVSAKSSVDSPQTLVLHSDTTEASAFSLDESVYSSNTNDSEWQPQSADSASPVQYWSEEYQQAYLYDPVTGVSTWL